MNILAIDLGTFSVKFIEAALEHRQLALLSYQEINVYEVKKKMSKDASIEDVFFQIIKEYLKEPFQGKIIFQLPNKFITTRYLKLPVPSKKKAEMMIPFQLEEDLPYPISSAHYVSHMFKDGDSINAMINISQLNVFDSFYTRVESNNIMPSLMTSELSVVNSFVHLRSIKKQVAIIDIGHETTKVYFIRNSRVISNHVSHLAGKAITEIISQTYEISIEEATIYKHKNCFLLTENQYKEVDKDQQEFAKLMRQTLMPLVLDLKRWLLGYRIQYRNSVDKIYLMGGSSNINNITNFITQSLSVRTEKLGGFDREITHYDIPEDHQQIYSLASIMTGSQISKDFPSNFLTRNFSSGHGQSISVYSTMFILSRMVIVAALIIISLVVERSFFLNKQVKSLDRDIKKELKKDSLGQVPAKIRAIFRNRPSKVLSIVKSGNKKLKIEIETVLASVNVNALIPLSRLSNSLSRNEMIDLTKFVYPDEDGGVLAVFQAKASKDLETMLSFLDGAGLRNYSNDFKKGSKKVTLNFGE